MSYLRDFEAVISVDSDCSFVAFVIIQLVPGIVQVLKDMIGHGTDFLHNSSWCLFNKSFFLKDEKICKAYELHQLQAFSAHPNELFDFAFNIFSFFLIIGMVESLVEYGQRDILRTDCELSQIWELQ